jgi:hypothetical protein
MTLAEALQVASQARPKHQQPLDKLRAGTTTDQITAGVVALAKSFGVITGTVAGMQDQLDRARAGIVLYEDHLNQPQPSLPQGYLQ